MEKAFAKAEELASSVKEYINTRIEAAKLNAAEKTSGIVANIIAAIIVTLFFLFCIVFASTAAAVSLGEWMGKPWAGFLIVAFLYFLTGIIVWAKKEKIIRLPIMNALIKQLFKHDDAED
jgi:ABC-type uncharacterized transport system fused permease/ATPase subunit